MEKKSEENPIEASGMAIEKESTATPTPNDPAPAEVPKPKDAVLAQDVPDPEEDDLDDLDGLSFPFCAASLLTSSRYAR
jgi:peroxin-19